MGAIATRQMVPSTKGQFSLAAICAVSTATTAITTPTTNAGANLVAPTATTTDGAQLM